jgi:hypothetical protein
MKTWRRSVDRRPTQEMRRCSVVAALVEIAAQLLGSSRKSNEFERNANNELPSAAILVIDKLMRQTAQTNHLRDFINREKFKIGLAQTTRDKSGTDAVVLEVEVMNAVGVTDEYLDTAVFPHIGVYAPNWRQST